MAAPRQGHGGAVVTSPSKHSLSLCRGGYFWERFSFSTAYSSTGVLAPDLQLPCFPPDLNFAILHVPAWSWHPNAKMSLRRPVLPPRQANSSPDQRAPAALSASLAHLAQPPKPTGRGGFDGHLLTKKGAPGDSVYPTGGFRPADSVESTPCSLTCWGWQHRREENMLCL